MIVGNRQYLCGRKFKRDWTRALKLCDPAFLLAKVEQRLSFYHRDLIGIGSERMNM